MKINFTKKQFRTLLDLVYVADFMVNGIRLPDESIKEYEELVQYIYSFAKEMGCESLIEYSKEYNEYHETREFDDDSVNQLIEEYDAHVFWEELVYRLAKRDMEKDIAEIKDVDRDEFVRMLWAKEGIYEDEFYENGLDNVKVGDI